MVRACLTITNHGNYTEHFIQQVRKSPLFLYVYFVVCLYNLAWFLFKNILKSSFVLELG